MINFIMGFLVGGLCGVVGICLCQVAKDENEYEGEDEYY